MQTHPRHMEEGDTECGACGRALFGRNDAGVTDTSEASAHCDLTGKMNCKTAAGKREIDGALISIPIEGPKR